MSPLAIPATIAYYLLLLYFFVLWGRFILDLSRNVARDWKPKGLALVVTEVVFAMTDPPIRLARRVVPSLRVGGMTFDFAWSIVMLLVVVLMYITFLPR